MKLKPCALIGTLLTSSALPALAAPVEADKPTESVMLEEIVVSAQRVQENQQRVPIAVSAVNAAMIESMGIKGSQDIAIAAPAVNFQPTPSGANITIRGIGGSGASVDEAANAVYIDGVYQASTPGLMFSLNNVERIEVAKGPQGTLFGRNSTGGVIQIITRTPQQDFAADMSAGYGNYGTHEEQLYVTGGLSSRLAADLAVYNQRQTDGWGHNVATGADAYKGRSFATRGKLLWDIDDDSSLTLSGMYSRTRPASGQGGSILPGEKTKGSSSTPGTGYTGFYNINYDGQYKESTDQNQLAATLKHDFGWAQLVNIASHGRTRLTLLQDRDFGPAATVQVAIDNPVTTTSEELQLLSPAGSSVKWAAGFYYFDNDIKLDPVHYTGPGIGSGFPTQFLYSGAKTRSYSFYGQATAPLPFDDATNLTLGLRNTSEDRILDAVTTVYTGASTTVHASTDNHKMTWRAALDHQFSSAVMAYASYTTGFHSGLYNIASPTQPAVQPEYVDSYEVGLKTELFDHRLRFNTAAFYYKFDNIQVKTLNSLGAAVLVNAAQADIKGIDIDFAAALTGGLTLQGGLSYLDSTYNNFANVPFYRVNPAGGLTQFAGDASDNRTVFSPRWVATLAAVYTTTTPIGPMTASVTENYNDGFFFDPQNRLSSGSFNLVNANLTWSLNDSVDFQLWARNLLDKHYYAFIGSSTLGDEFYPSAPRTYGVTLRWRLG